MGNLKANKIRVGNFYEHNGEIRQVTVNTIEEIWEAERTWAKEAPINGEILVENFGFKEVATSMGSFYYLDGFRIDSFPWGLALLGYPNCKIQYIYTVQNLYSDLCNKELELIKPFNK